MRENPEGVKLDTAEGSAESRQFTADETGKCQFQQVLQEFV